MAGEPIDQYGDGSTARDYTYIDDIIQGVMAAGRYTATDFEIINLGGSATNTLQQLILSLEEIIGIKARINQLPEQPGDVPLTYANVSKADHILGYAPRTCLSSGLARYVEWLIPITP
jgi:UDP-glucuronate 4-epimerase